MNESGHGPHGPHASRPRNLRSLRNLTACALALLLLAACAAYDGRGLVAGRSTQVEVEALMGPVAERRPLADGGSVLYFTRAPQGRHSYAATLGADGILRSLEQILTLENINALMAGSTNRNEVRERFGPPGTASRLPRQERDVWEYKWLHYDDKRVLWVQFSDDGIVREVINMHDFTADGPRGRGGRGTR